MRHGGAALDHSSAWRTPDTTRERPKSAPMPYRKILPAVVTLLLLIPAVGIRSAEQTLISAGSSWRYNDSGSNLGTAWRAPAYNDASWPAGLAQLGYGDGDESTVLSYGGNPSNRRITYYFRRAFTVADPAAIAALTLRYVRDDGCIIYLNGVEVVRSNMPAGTVTYTTRATASIGGADESAWLQAPLDPSQLVKGTNVVAVEIHQQTPSSSDISFDLELRATEAQAAAPGVTLIAPANQSQSNTSALMFSASVSAPAGLASATLYVRGAPQTVVFSGPLQVEDAQITAETPATADGSGAAINIDGQTPHAHGLMQVSFAGRSRQRAGAAGRRHHVSDAPVDLHRLRERDAGLPAHAGLDRGSGNLERARARIGVGVPWRRRRGFERGCAAGCGLHDHRPASRRRDPVRSGMERRRAQLRNRVHRRRHRRGRFHQQRVGQFSRTERRLQEQSAGDRDQTAFRTEHHGHLLHATCR